MPPIADPRVAELVTELVARLGPREARLATELLTEAAGLIGDEPAQLDLKIATAALAEMRDAFAVFAPYKQVPKVTIFGSARVQSDDPVYVQAHNVAAELARAGWMVVTGAGPGIMQAGMEGAGRELSIGVSIRLPFESGANSVIADDAKHVAMKYFFTRKLMLVKESAAFVCLPGGFGTLDETFELLTLTQTGKGLPVPIVFLDRPGDPFWERIDALVREQLVPRGLVAAHDTSLYRVVESAEEAVAEITRFYSNYHSIRIVGDDMVVRMRRGPDAEQLADLNERFGYLSTNGKIRVTEPYTVEVRHDDHLELARIAFAFPGRGYAELRGLIDTLNTYADPPPEPPVIEPVDPSLPPT